MIKKFILISAFLPLMATNVYAGISCTKDNRLVDGFYSHIELSDSYSGSYNVVYATSYIDRTNGRIYTSKRTLLTGLRCNTKGSLAYCANSDYKSIKITTNKKKSLGLNNQQVIETKTVNIETDYANGLLNLSYNMKDCNSTF